MKIGQTQQVQDLHQTKQAGIQQYAINQNFNYQHANYTHKVEKRRLIKWKFILIVVLIIINFLIINIAFSLLPSNSVKPKIKKPKIKTVVNSTKFQQVTAIFLIQNQQQGLKSIESLVSHCQFKNIIIGSNSNVGIDTNNFKHFSQIQWVIQKKLQLEIFILDKLISKVKTKYFFLAKTQWSYGDSSLIQYSLKMLSQFTNVLQVIPRLEEQLNNKEVGFSLLPGLHRTKDYFLTKKGYSDIARGYLSSKQVENKISQFYLKQKMYAIISTKDFNIQKLSYKKHQKFQSSKQKFEQIEIKQYQIKLDDRLYEQKQKKQQNQMIDNWQTSSTPQFSIQKPMQGQNFFTNNYRNAQNFLSLQQYLFFNGATKILAISCDQTCSQNYKSRKSQLKVIKINHISQIIPHNEIYDWITSQKLQNFVNNYIITNLRISNYVRFGYCLRLNNLEYSKQDLQKIVKYFIANGFYFDQTKSLTFRHIQEKLVFIFIKGIKLRLKPIQSPYPKNTLAIQTVLKIKQNIPFLKEWMAYHINLGFDKFFLYDNSNSVTSPNDPIMTSSNNKFGMAYSCIGMKDQDINSQWQMLWSQFYDFIVYIKFQPKDEAGNIIYDQLKAQKQYIHYYKNVAKYTLFIDVDEFLFSPDDKNLIQILSFYQKNLITSLKISQRHFLNRFCTKNIRVTDIYQYLPQNQNKLWDAKLLAQTSSFLPFGNIHDGRSTRGRQISLSSNQFRINHYNFQKEGLDLMRKNLVSDATKFEIDSSARRYRNILQKICKNQCSQKFALSCQAGLQWNNCLDLSKQYPYQKEKIDKMKQQQQSKIIKNQINQLNKQIQQTYIPQTYHQKTLSEPKIQIVRPTSVIEKTKSQTYLSQIQQNLRKSQTIYEWELLEKTNNLSICLVVLPSQKYTFQVLMNSIEHQQYPNLITITFNNTKSTQNLLIYNPNNQQTEQNINYYSFKSQMKLKCKLNSLTMFVTVPLQNRALKQMNSIMQKYKAYIAYSKTAEFTQILAFYPRIYQLLDINDFSKSNQHYLKSNNREILTLGMLQLSQLYNVQIDKSSITKVDQPTYFSIFRNSSTKLQRTPYVKLLRLSQDMQTSITMMERSLKNVDSLKQVQLSQMTRSKMFRAIDRQQLWYLPEGHSIQQLEFEHYARYYKIKEYQDINKQVRFCVTVLSHNNIQNNRYIKVMNSIVQQKYDNYHIVFIDDFSTDNNIKGTIEYMNRIGFPKDRITYVQNLNRNYATYNIINAAYNYCGIDDVQMLMDGDDQFIGKYAFHVMNSYYQNPQIWVAYSNYKTNYYNFGRSRQFTSEFEHASGGKRSFISIFGAIRSWRVRVLYRIPAAHHKMANGQWLDTVYDDALCHPLAELSTVKRMKYVPQILYQYNMKYGDNDDSTPDKIQHRTQTYKYVLGLSLLQPLKTLQSSSKNKDVQKELTADFNVKYKVISSQ